MSVARVKQHVQGYSTDLENSPVSRFCWVSCLCFASVVQVSTPVGRSDCCMYTNPLQFYCEQMPPIAKRVPSGPDFVAGILHLVPSFMPTSQVIAKVPWVLHTLKVFNVPAGLKECLLG